jgi:hypothetical protein
MSRRSGYRFADKGHAPSKNLQPFPIGGWMDSITLIGNGCRAPIPNFASLRGMLSAKFGNQRSTSKINTF